MLLLLFSDLSLNPSPQARDFTDCKQEHHLIDALLYPLSPVEKGLGIEVEKKNISCLISAI
jgi:hypothetical protein